MMSMRAFLVILLLMTHQAAAGENTSIKVIVHAGNGTANLSKKQISDIFLKKTVRWPDNTPIVPVDLKMDFDLLARSDGKLKETLRLIHDGRTNGFSAQ
jgi:hypothetical protein